MMRIAFYVSAHGFGHAVRMREVARRILLDAPQSTIYFNTSAPAWLFGELPPDRFILRKLRCDVGAIQKDSLHIDIPETVRQNELFYKRIDDLVDREKVFIRRMGIRCVIGDIPPLAFLAADAAGVPGVAIGNFSWDWIYEPYVLPDRGYAYLLDIIRTAYRRSSLLLRLPFHGDMAAFPAPTDVPVIAQRGEASIASVRKRLGIRPGDTRKLIFLSLGGHDATPIRFSDPASMDDYLFISYFPLPLTGENVVTPAGRTDPPHHEIVNAVDLVIGKLGYCTLTECIAHRTALLYTGRSRFRESAVLETAAHAYCSARYIPEENFISGAWRPFIQRTLIDSGHAPWPRINVDGAGKIAHIINAIR
jgi:L-arabinokinase